MGVYSEFIEMRCRLLSESGIEPPPLEWLERGLQVAKPPATAHRSTRHGRRVLWLVPSMAAAAGIVVLFVSISWRQLAFNRGLEALAGQLREDSSGSLLYSDDLLPSPRDIRGSAGNSKAGSILAELAHRYNRGARSEDDVFWLIAGFLSENDLNNADAYLRESLRRSPSSGRLHNLAAILAFKRNDLETAAVHLEAALAIERSAASLLNLAIVRREQGQQAAARDLAREVTERFPGTGVSRLARGLSAPGG
jgi:tetratricopeptide (TPR) repeat protein